MWHKGITKYCTGNFTRWRSQNSSEYNTNSLNMNKEHIELELREYLSESGLDKVHPDDATSDFRGVFYMFKTEEGNGRTRPVTHGYRPQHKIDETYFTSGAMRFMSKDFVWPGESRVHTGHANPEK